MVHPKILLRDKSPKKRCALTGRRCANAQRVRPPDIPDPETKQDADSEQALCFRVCSEKKHSVKDVIKDAPKAHQSAKRSAGALFREKVGARRDERQDTTAGVHHVHP